MDFYATNLDLMLRLILSNPDLHDKGKYGDCSRMNLEDALHSENTTVQTLARILQRKNEGATTKTIHKEIVEYLRNTLAE